MRGGSVLAGVGGVLTESTEAEDESASSSGAVCPFVVAALQLCV
jgi:hypothetical protein